MTGFKAISSEGGRARFAIGDQEFVFRVPDLEDLAALDSDFPLLPVDERLEEMVETNASGVFEEIAKDPKRLRRFMGRTNRLLSKLSLKPILTEEFPVEPVEGEIPVRSLSDNNRIALFVTLMALAGFNEQATEEVGNLPGTGLSSSTSTRSLGDTAVDPAT